MPHLQQLAFAMPGGMEWIVVLLVALLIFGSRLPKIMRGLGSSVREFRGGIEDSDGTTNTAPAASPVNKHDA